MTRASRDRAPRSPFAALATLLLAACGGGSTAHVASGALAVRDAPPPLRASGTMHVEIATPKAIAIDLASARCSLDGPDRGGLRIAGEGPGAVQRVLVVARRADGDGDAVGSADVSLDDGAIFGGRGSRTTVHVADGGKSGTATFAHATYAGSAGVADASGTIAWSCR